MSLCGLSYESPQSEALGSLCKKTTWWKKDQPKGNSFQGDDLLRYAYTLGVACFRKKIKTASPSKRVYPRLLTLSHMRQSKYSRLNHV